MPSNGFAHCSDPTSCHHCHITSPIPMAQLIKTHPLRPKLPSPRLLSNGTKHQRNDDEEGSSGFSSDNAPITKSRKWSPKGRSGLHGDEILRSLLQRENEVELLKPTPSYHHEFCKNGSKDRSPKSSERAPQKYPPISSSPRLREYHSNQISQKHSPLIHSSKSRDLITHNGQINGSPYAQVEKRHSPHSHSDKLRSSPRGDHKYSPRVKDHLLQDSLYERRHHLVTSSPRIGNQYSINSDQKQSPTLSSLRREEELQLDYPQFSPDIIQSASRQKINPIFNDLRHPQKIYPGKEFGTQTSKISGIYGDLFSDYSSINIYRNLKKKDKKYKFNLPMGLLCAGYALLIVIAVAIAVVLSQRSPFFQDAPQRSRTFPSAGSSGPRPINIPGAVRISNPNAGTAGTRTFNVPGAVRISKPASGGGGRRVQESNQRRPSPVFTQADFDYLDTGVLDDFINKPRQPSRTSSIFPPFRSITQQPQHVATPAPIQRAPIPAPTPAPARPTQVDPVRVSDPAPRRSSSPRKIFRGRFDHPSFEGEVVEEITTKKPEVAILDSWSNVNSDGSFSFGYINSDGSFKNETRGSDCITRGIYGYVDPLTREAISYPYTTGIKCDPNSPDYFYDYETGLITNEEALPPSRRPGAGAAGGGGRGGFSQGRF